MEPTSVVVELQDIVNENDKKSLWIFGYGSLCWNPGFSFEKAVAGTIHGYSRKFWQGNSTHRGTEEKPGRVVTLVKEKGSVVHGLAFQISGEAALSYLNKRECKLGGYVVEFARFYPRARNISFNTILYIATAQNELWLGDAPASDIADQIVESCGASGHNVEYLIRLAAFMHYHFPNEKDDHLFAIERLVIMKLRDRKACLKALMGDERETITFISNASLDDLQRDGLEERQNSFQYAANVPVTIMRCLNM
uniref:glutathione-specific gamma-glutamylcyclotransferase n=1 Tax=Photinus pyralis TaxID=7054 RepID=A0A1Y1MUZ1_PHOPY